MDMTRHAREFADGMDGPLTPRGAAQGCSAAAPRAGRRSRRWGWIWLRATLSALDAALEEDERRRARTPFLGAPVPGWPRW
jgi:hypothetical protein